VLRNPASQTPIVSLDQSPLAAGSIYGLRVGRRSGGTDYGQGSQTGLGAWVPIPPAADADLRAQPAALKLTGYYGPEDIDMSDCAAIPEPITAIDSKAVPMNSASARRMRSAASGSRGFTAAVPSGAERSA
jgi:hypothetical protein